MYGVVTPLRKSLISLCAFLLPGMSAAAPPPPPPTPIPCPGPGDDADSPHIYLSLDDGLAVKQLWYRDAQRRADGWTEYEPSDYNVDGAGFYELPATDDPETCPYDLKAKMKDGRLLQLRAVNLCGPSSVGIYWNITAKRSHFTRT